ncbi:MAG: DUF3025 domain-containing protein [Proteobacteria bacterium]|nr:DUF3025 domain-containing protein [Pseudomonadota bacterium]
MKAGADNAPAALAQRPLFDAIAHLLMRFPAPELPGLVELDALYAEATAGADVRQLRFVAPVEGAAYEAHIARHDAVPTRPADWHDFFNAMAWCVWPRSKSTCNRLHLQASEARSAAGLSGRGPLRDALTQFDECGVLVVGCDAEILHLLAVHEWEEALWTHRSRLLDCTRFLVFGHASWDQLRAPFTGLCAKAIYRQVDETWLALPAAQRQAEADAWLAEYLVGIADELAPRLLKPLPLLGIPGVTPASESADYYRDRRQFRPLPQEERGRDRHADALPPLARRVRPDSEFSSRK